jgi:hypothetical protein
MRHKIIIDKDGWVSLTNNTPLNVEYGPLKVEYGLGDIGVDVEIVDLRGDPVQQERERIVEEVEKIKKGKSGEMELSFSNGEKANLKSHSDITLAYNKALDDDIIKIIKGQ